MPIPKAKRSIEIKLPGWFCAAMFLIVAVGITLVIVCLNNGGLHRVDPWQQSSECLKVIATDETRDHQLIDQLVGQNDKLTNKLLDQVAAKPKIIHHETIIRIPSSSSLPATNQFSPPQQPVPSPPPLSFSAVINPSKDGVTAEIRKGAQITISYSAINAKSVEIRKTTGNIWGGWIPVSGLYTDSPTANTGYEIKATGLDGCSASYKFAAIVKKNDDGLAAFLLFVGIAAILDNNNHNGGPSGQLPPGCSGSPSGQHSSY